MQKKIKLDCKWKQNKEGRELVHMINAEMKQ